MASITTYASASEGGHWYDEQGRQIAEVPSADGKRLIKPDIRHARKLQLAPGITSIIRCASRPDLELWKQRQAIQSALTLPRRSDETEADWLKRIEQDMQEHARQAAEEGTRIHAALQAWLERGEVVEEHAERVAGMVACLTALSPKPWKSETGCISRLGYGTKADLCAPGWVLDLKTKDDKDLSEVKTYDSHWQQLWATRHALGVKARCGILFASRISTAVRFVEVTDDQLSKGEAMFRPLLAYWQAKNNHRPIWATESAA